MSTPRFAAGLKFTSAALFVLALGACATAPVQALSNARQAIAAAERAGAARLAPEHLATAKQRLDAAIKALHYPNYERARKRAIRARRAAVQALKRSRESAEAHQAQAP